MDQYAESPGHSTHCCMETLHPLSTSSIVARHLLYLMVQGKVTVTIHLDATPSTLSLPPAPHLHHPPHFMPSALSAATVPIYLGLGQAPNNAGSHTRWLGL